MNYLICNAAVVLGSNMQLPVARLPGFDRSITAYVPLLLEIELLAVIRQDDGNRIVQKVGMFTCECSNAVHMLL